MEVSSLLRRGLSVFTYIHLLYLINHVNYVSHIDVLCWKLKIKHKLNLCTMKYWHIILRELYYLSKRQESLLWFLQQWNNLVKLDLTKDRFCFYEKKVAKSACWVVSTVTEILSKILFFLKFNPIYSDLFGVWFLVKCDNLGINFRMF